MSFIIHSDLNASSVNPYRTFNRRPTSIQKRTHQDYLQQPLCLLSLALAAQNVPIGWLASAPTFLFTQKESKPTLTYRPTKTNEATDRAKSASNLVPTVAAATRAVAVATLKALPALVSKMTPPIGTTSEVNEAPLKVATPLALPPEPAQPKEVKNVSPDISPDISSQKEPTYREVVDELLLGNKITPITHLVETCLDNPVRIEVIPRIFAAATTLTDELVIEPLTLGEDTTSDSSKATNSTLVHEDVLSTSSEEEAEEEAEEEVINKSKRTTMIPDVPRHLRRICNDPIDSTPEELFRQLTSMSYDDDEAPETHFKQKTAIRQSTDPEAMRLTAQLASLALMTLMSSSFGQLAGKP